MKKNVTQLLTLMFLVAANVTMAQKIPSAPQAPTGDEVCSVNGRHWSGGNCKVSACAMNEDPFDPSTPLMTDPARYEVEPKLLPGTALTREFPMSMNLDEFTNIDGSGYAMVKVYADITNGSNVYPNTEIMVLWINRTATTASYRFKLKHVDGHVVTQYVQELPFPVAGTDLSSPITFDNHPLSNQVRIDFDELGGGLVSFDAYRFYSSASMPINGDPVEMENIRVRYGKFGSHCDTNLNKFKMIIPGNYWHDINQL